MVYDKIILGAGLFGLYAALKSIEKGERVLVLEHDDAPFKRASWINQARLHKGYHYPRSYATAKKSAYYFDRFAADYHFAIFSEFNKIYATSTRFSYTNAAQFAKFCQALNIPCEPIRIEHYFKPTLCDGAFATKEYAFDGKMIGNHFIQQLNASPNFTVHYQCHLESIDIQYDKYQLITDKGRFETPYLINATYASLNQVLIKAGLEPFNMKYELCEVVLCRVSDNLKAVGITVMDGPYFSIMPFGNTGLHSLTAVDSTPHFTSQQLLPEFPCQTGKNNCSKTQLGNCNQCPDQPKTAFASMRKLAKNYFNDDIEIHYERSLFAMKAILMTSEVNDSRPTIVKFSHEKPRFLSVFSGKINTIYDLDEVL